MANHLSADNEQNTPKKDDLIDLVAISNIYKKSIKIALISTLSFSVIGALFTFNQPEIFRAEALVSSVNDQNNSGRNSINSQFSGIANLIGLSSQSSSGAEINTAIMLSGSFLESFIVKNNLMQSIFEEEWDILEKKWINDNIPPIRLAVEKLQNSVSVEKQLSLSLVAVEWTDPELAALWANGLIKHLNNHIRQQKIDESEKSINFLRKELIKTSLVNNENMLFAIIEEQTKNIVLANVREEYAFKFIDPAIPPKEKIRPLNIQNIILSGFVGFILGSLFIFTRTYIKRFSKSLF